MSTPELNEAAWRKSSYSGSGGDCVEVADLVNSTAVRDSKAAHGPALIFPDQAWNAFVADVKHAR
ncbi:DUF397 domain-containing protein [Streptomyces sp. NBC_00237]|uniref:DUF397 domain-containing protein n=1 Tax=Streptomyces sp. NBC_00237 TaxID=2975687 RepID=UPI002254BA5E|nr:DUF397 domain-containing protein [Streptomyces sp. NBC_00237]MCX5205009.1 DUF397 domain-containing protein [Streptomyces sp. NBC_00237]